MRNFSVNCCSPRRRLLAQLGVMETGYRLVINHGPMRVKACRISTSTCSGATAGLAAGLSET